MGTSYLKGRVISVQPTLGTAANAAGTGMCAPFEIKLASEFSAGPVHLIHVAVVDTAKVKTAFDLLLFNALPTVASAVNAALDITAAEMRAKFVGKVSVAAADFADLSAVSIASENNLQLLLQVANPALVGSGEVKSLWGVLVCRSGTPTYGATGLQLQLGVKNS